VASKRAAREAKKGLDRHINTPVTWFRAAVHPASRAGLVSMRPVPHESAERDDPWDDSPLDTREVERVQQKVGTADEVEKYLVDEVRIPPAPDPL
jgi:hypothetical protein